MRKLKHHHVFWPRITFIPSLLILPSSPPLPLCHGPTRDHSVTWERTEEGGSLLQYCPVPGCLREGPGAHGSLPPRRVFLIKFTHSTFNTLWKHQPSPNTILFRALTILTFHLWRRSWSSFPVFGLLIISLLLLFSLKANWYLLKDDLIVIFTSRLIYCKYQSFASVPWGIPRFT